MNPCRSCKDDCKQCDVYIERLNLRKKNFALEYIHRKKEKEISTLKAKLEQANTKISNLLRKEESRWK